MNKLIAAAAALAVCAGSAGAQVKGDPTAAPMACPGAEGLSFICNMYNAEDLRVIPGTKWMVVSGMIEGAGIKLVDTQAKTAKFWNTSAEHKVMPDRATYPACAAPQDPARLNTHGLSLRALADGRYQLLTTAHGGRETIEVYIIDARPAAPTLTWVGCIPAPEGIAFNSVTSFADGLILATHPQSSRIFWWKKGEAGFLPLPGAVANRVNGIDTAKDEKSFYAAALGDRQIVRFDLVRGADGALSAKEAVRSPVLEYFPDNVAWDGERLIAAGGFYDDPVCPRVAPPPPGQSAPPSTCYRGYVVSQFDPATLSSKIMAYEDSRPDFGAVAIAVVTGDDLWLSSARSDRLAWRKLPRPE